MAHPQPCGAKTMYKKYPHDAAAVLEPCRGSPYAIRRFAEAAWSWVYNISGVEFYAISSFNSLFPYHLFAPCLLFLADPPPVVGRPSGKLLPVKPDKISTNLLNALRNCKYRLKPIFENGLIRIYSTRDKFSLMELKFRYKCLSRNGLI